jgi:hypothetical protein
MQGFSTSGEQERWAASFSWLGRSLKMLGEKRSQQFSAKSFSLNLEILRQNRNIVAAMEKTQNAQNQNWQYRDVLRGSR